jgi:hypothetical protein
MSPLLSILEEQEKTNVMKHTIIFLTLWLFAMETFGQAQTNQTFSKDDYLIKSKAQKTTAWILLGTGLGIAAAGGIVQLIAEDGRDGGWGFDFTGTYIAIGGGIVAASSIPFFISSSSNKKKAASVVISNRKIFLPRANSFSLTAQPTITLNIGL